MSIALEFNQVNRRFLRNVALHNASFRVPAGSVAALLGPNGAGKSTALKIALNLLRPSSGEVRTLGADSRKLGPSELRRIGYVADGMELPLWMTVDRFLAWCRPLYPTWDPELEQSLRKRFALPGERRLRALSRGQRMKAALASVLAYRPELLVLDEPFSGLDPLVRDEFIQGLLELADGEGFTVVISSHDLEETARLADHFVFLDHGQVTLDESADVLLARHRRVEVILPEGYGSVPELPSEWIGADTAGRVLRFTDTRHDQARLLDSVRRMFPGSSDPDIHPVTLREIFITLTAARRLAATQP
ncbi:ABC transporter ATP-binding protein [Luteolibacter marinus]|uniref:ABC transporter ATP-binding protein n=1 Tax=Luteolibacter marinus TaxID=2776705 RepID=UPI0018671B32|nr:ABC transporter ATP-binding protein [Luteolibacter marinus]